MYLSQSNFSFTNFAYKHGFYFSLHLRSDYSTIEIENLLLIIPIHFKWNRLYLANLLTLWRQHNLSIMSSNMKRNRIAATGWTIAWHISIYIHILSITVRICLSVYWTIFLFISEYKNKRLCNVVEMSI